MGAGKGTVVDYLVKEKDFKHYSVRNLLVKLIEKEGKAVNRDSMTATANRLRAEKGSAYLIEKLFEEAKKSNGNCVIESIRTEGEISSLREKGKFYLLAVDADIKLRYERIVKRASETDRVSFDKFKSDEKREMTSNDPSKQNLGRCMELADYRIENNSTIGSLNKQITEILYEIQKNNKKDKI